MASKTDIANMALSRLGETQISDFTENTPNASAVRLHYGTVLDSLLRMHNWNFATARATLTALSTAPIFGHTYAYALPADCIRLSSLNGIQADQAETDFRIEGINLLTDATAANICYVRRIEDTTLFDSLFVEVLILKLAAVLALDVTNSSTKRQEMLDEAAGMMDEASFSDASENTVEILDPLGGSQYRQQRSVDVYNDFY